MSVDIRTLEILADRLSLDAKHGRGISPAAAASIAGIIQEAIGAPLIWPSRILGANAAMDIFPGDNAARLAFNWGVKWTVENYAASIEVKERKE